MSAVPDYGHIGRVDWAVDLLARLCRRYMKWSSLAGAFIAGLFVNACSDPSVGGLRQLFIRIFDFQARPLNILAWVSALVGAGLPAVSLASAAYGRRRSYYTRLARLYRERIDASLQSFQRGRIGWGECLTLQSCPALQDGWPIASVRIEYEPTSFVLSRESEESYTHYMKEANLFDDRTRLMLIQNPRAFSDAPSLNLRVKRTRYSHIRFYQEWVMRDPSRRSALIEHTLREGHINHPNTLCMHLVVVTSDGYLLITQASSKVDYYPSLWACSIGEQLDMNDLKGPEMGYALNWAGRALWEELGVSRDSFDPDNVRVMSVFLEGSIVNYALVTVALLRLSRSELDALMDKHPRTDYEYQAWEFITWEDLPRELLSPSRTYHPSTGIRMFYAGLFYYGAPELHRRLMGLSHSQSC